MRIIGDHGREILFGPGVFLLNKPFFQIAPIKGQLLQFAFTAPIADGTIERMIGKQELEHRPLGLFDFLALRRDHHAVGADDRARCLKLRHLLNPHQTHAAGGLQSQVGVVAERRNVELIFATDIDQARAFRDLKVFAVDGDFD